MEFEQTHKQIVDRYNGKKAIFNAMVQGRHISLENSMEFAISQMHSQMCYIRKDIEDKNLPYVLRSKWIASGKFGKRIKEYWLEKTN